MSHFNRILPLAIAIVLALLVPTLVMAQLPDVPSKSPGAPSKGLPLASPQAAPLASPQASFAPQYDQPAVVLRAPQIYAVNRQVILQAAPAVYAAPIAYAAVDTGCVANQVVVQRAVVGHGVVHQAQINHGLVGAGVGRQPKKIKTKQVTRVKRGLFGGRG